ncbi:MAG TPA: hypothetical protein DEO88_16240 [Syntrophobacteraceae bacterium]|nr:hypothetical protein [Syntrophobacteraceae bacterium]
MMRAVRLVLAVAVLALLASCAMEATWTIDGKWQKKDGTEVVEFSRTGMVTVTDAGATASARYTFADTKHLKIEMGSLGALVLKVSCTRDKLTLTNPEGVVTTYSRIY